MKRNCECCEKGMTFVRMPEESAHDYRLVCSTCRSFVKWGTQSDYDFLDKEYGDIPIEDYNGEGAGPTIDRLYAERRTGAGTATIVSS